MPHAELRGVILQVAATQNPSLVPHREFRAAISITPCITSLVTLGSAPPR